MVDEAGIAAALTRLIRQEPRKHTQAFIAEYCGVSENAVSKWIKTGQIADRNLECVAELYGVDYWALKTQGRIVDPNAMPTPEKNGEKDIPWLLYSRAKNLDETLQLSLLNMVETIIATMREARRPARKKRRA